MNDIQKMDDPKAYEPDMEVQMNAKRKRDQELEEQKKRHEQAKAEKLQQIQEHERALFDFDEEIDHLQEVHERYPGMPLEEDG